MAIKIKIRRGTSAQWASSTRVLDQGELGLDTTLNKIKAGDGTSLWPALAFISALPSETIEIAQDAIDAALVAGTGITKSYNDNANTITVAVDSTIANKTYVDSAVSALSSQANIDYVTVSSVGNPDGVASLDSFGKIPDSEISSDITRNSAAQTLTSKIINLGTEITSIAAVDSITALLGQNNIAILQSGIDKGGKINISAEGVISIAAPGIGYTTGVVSNQGGTRFNITVGGNTLSGTLNEFNTALTDGNFATESYVSTAISSIIDSAPATLNTLNELAAAINDDASFAASVTATLGTKAPLDSPTFTGTVVLPTNTIRSSDLTWEMYSAESQLPNPGVKHGMFAHVHGTGGGYFAHSGKWWRLALMDEPSVDYYVTSSGTGSYIVNGVLNGGINLVRGKKYRIIVNAVGYPFSIQTVEGAYSAANVYTTGIINSGTENGSIVIELPQDAPNNLYYACEMNPSMNGTVAVQAEEDTVTIISKSGSYTIAPIDSGRVIEMSAGGTVTIADSPSFPVGYSVDILQTGTSQVTIAGVAFTPNATPGLKLRTQWSSATLLKRALNSWVVLGDLSA
jgi:hypothetical protein